MDLEVCKFEKITSGWKIFFFRIPSPRIPRQVGQGRGIFFKRDIQPWGISAKVPELALLTGSRLRLTMPGCDIFLQ